MAVIAYCVKCKQKREMKDAKEVTMKNGRKAMQGVCSVCGTGMYLMMSRSRFVAMSFCEPRSCIGRLSS